MKIYTQNDKFTIWENENYLYFIQMSGKEVESKSFDFAAEAIAEASDQMKIDEVLAFLKNIRQSAINYSDSNGSSLVDTAYT